MKVSKINLLQFVVFRQIKQKMNNIGKILLKNLAILMVLIKILF